MQFSKGQMKHLDSEMKEYLDLNQIMGSMKSAFTSEKKQLFNESFTGSMSKKLQPLHEDPSTSLVLHPQSSMAAENRQKRNDKLKK